MRILSVKATNFASYKELDFDFDSKGLTLISGPTGAGKSTLCDIVPWCLFGVTAKNGTVDEVRAWSSKDPTEGHVVLDVAGVSYWITRIRGAVNDLYYIVDGAWEHPRRGKDLADTQKQINEFLGFDAELYLSGAYFHEFSRISSFFTSSAKQRREITEQLVDLSMAVSLVGNMFDYRRDLKVDKERLIQDAVGLQAKVDIISKNIKDLEKKGIVWAKTNKSHLDRLRHAATNFVENTNILAGAFENEHIKKRVELEYEVNEYEQAFTSEDSIKQQKATQKAMLDRLGTTKCDECGAPVKVEQRMIITKKIYDLERLEAENQKTSINLVRAKERLEKHNQTLLPGMKKILEAPNRYQDQLDEAENEQNPYAQQVQEQENQLFEHTELTLNTQGKLDDLALELSDVALLSDTIDAFRATLIQSAASQLQDKTNEQLINYFDAEIRVEFSPSNSDKLDVTIYKDSNICSYAQLSKGQRQLLDLSFSVSAMEIIANHHGLDFSTIFFDEVLTGLDGNLKVKAYRLLEHLSTKHENVFCVEHNETFKSLFTRQYNVELVNGNSQIKET